MEMKSVWVKLLLLCWLIFSFMWWGDALMVLLDVPLEGVQGFFAYADTTETEINLAFYLQQIIRALYLLMRPLLAIAWAALDNSLVYWEIFFLKTSLWKMRQIMRNFANFALWGLFLYALLRNIFLSISWGDPWTGNRWFKSILKNILFATLAIQSSWFIFWALIDLSTVAVYSLWALPLTVVKNGDVPLSYVRFAKPDVVFSLDDTIAATGTDATHVVFYRCNALKERESAKEYILPCRIDWSSFVPQWETDAECSDVSADTREKRKCNNAKQRAATHKEAWKTVNEIRGLISDQYCFIEWKIIENQFEEPADECKLAHWRKDWGILDNQDVMADLECPPMTDLINSAVWMTWPLYTLYGSVMHMSEIALTPNHKWITEISLEFAIKVATALALMIPLFAMSIVLVVRVVLLWWFIIFLPFLVLWWIFFKEKAGSALGGKASLNAFLWLIFMPVVAVFAISITLIVLTQLQRSDQLIWPQFDIMEALWMEKTDTAWCTCDVGSWDWVPAWCATEKTLHSYCYNVFNITSLCFTWSQRVVWNGIINIMTWLALNMFWVWLMWIVVFAALKTSTITAGIVGWIESFAKNILKSVPIIPTFDGSSTSIAALQKTKDSVKQIPNAMLSDQYTNIDDYFKWRENKKDAAERSEGMAKAAESWDIALMKTEYEKANRSTWVSMADDSFSSGHYALWNWVNKHHKWTWTIKSTGDALAAEHVYDFIREQDSGWLNTTRDKLYDQTSVDDMAQWRDQLQAWLDWNKHLKKFSGNSTDKYQIYYDDRDGKKEITYYDRKQWVPDVKHYPVPASAADIKDYDALNDLLWLQDKLWDQAKTSDVIWELIWWSTWIADLRSQVMWKDTDSVAKVIELWGVEYTVSPKLDVNWTVIWVKKLTKKEQD